jgi:hypothetical protein
MKKKIAGSKKHTVKGSKKTRTVRKATTKRKSTTSMGKSGNLPAGKTASLKRTIRKIKTGLKQLEKVVGK